MRYLIYFLVAVATVVTTIVISAVFGLSLITSALVALGTWSILTQVIIKKLEGKKGK